MADLEVYPEVWRTHAGHVASVGDGLDTIDRASDAALSGLPFGILCTPLFAPAYAVAKLAFDSGTSTLSDRLEEDAQSLRRVATDFEQTDSQAAADANRTYPAP
ncbi:type VII secretion target [Actinomyces sp.]|uniref:type VII secretion target n=1 Tax=Actinomyces sp. TaxID=29317 RepID=UPI0026DD61D5|nr:type VII secretion target [Actinomyces sp.]MDO4901877.1 type VII secretion target [Actinomyces sp.]